MDDRIEKRRLALTAAMQTIARACRHIYEDELNSAKEAGDVMARVRLKAAMEKDWEAWIAPLVAELERLDEQAVIVEANLVPDYTEPSQFHAMLPMKAAE